MAEYGKRNPYGGAAVHEGKVHTHDWLLTRGVTSGKLTSVYWQYVDFVVKVSRKEKEFYFKGTPCYAVQVHPLSRYPLPPFAVTPQFRKAFKRAVARYSLEKLDRATSHKPPTRFLECIAEEMRKP